MKNETPKILVEVCQGVVEVFANCEVDVLVVERDCLSADEINCVIDNEPAAASRGTYDNRDCGLVEKAFSDYEATKKEED